MPREPRTGESKRLVGENPKDPLAPLRPHLEALIAKMNSSAVKPAGDALFAASGEELGAIAQAHAKTSRKPAATKK